MHVSVSPSPFNEVHGNVEHFFCRGERQGTLGTAKGFTGQYNDSLTGLDYYHARYYDPVVGVFLSADSVQGNMQGVNPYAYVGGNPETDTDPTGQYFSPAFLLANGLDGIALPGAGPFRIPSTLPSTTFGQLQPYTPPWPPITSLAPYHPRTAPHTIFSTARHSSTDITSSLTRNSLTTCGTAGPSQPLCGNWAVLYAVYLSTGGELALPGSWSLCPECGEGGGRSHNSQESGLSNDLLASDTEGGALGEAGGACSFTAQTVVATDHGERPIGTLHRGDKVWAYNPKTHKMELQPIEHVWVHSDNDLVDLTLTTTMSTQHGKPATKSSEVVHTNQKHPFFTLEHGFLPVAKIMIGMHILHANGSVGVVTGWEIVLGVTMMYNLEVAQDHTFTVGDGQWVVHNCTIPDDAASHIFRDAEGHMIDDTPANRQTLIDTVSSSNFQGTDRYGTEWYARTLPDGRQVWVQVRGSQIRNGGINDTPKPWDPNTGLSSPSAPGGP
jgi:RHS repeat-associated protein